MEYERYQAMVERYLHTLYQTDDRGTKLYESMRYSLLAGGKRTRPVLTLAVAELCGEKAELALPFACAVEMIHTYSLIHDDLPCMDDDDMRRGKPTNHKIYGETVSVLAGDALLTDAFSVLASAELPSDRIAEGVRVLSKAAGSLGMVLGQAVDMTREGVELTLRELSDLQAMKTGALITAAVELGAIAAGGSEKVRKALVTYGMRLGRAFQMRDDMLDVEGDEHTVGKTLGSDLRAEKTTFVTALGLSDCRKQISKLTEDAIAAISIFPYDETKFLRELALALEVRVS